MFDINFKPQAYHPISATAAALKVIGFFEIDAGDKRGTEEDQDQHVSSDVPRVVQLANTICRIISPVGPKSVFHETPREAIKAGSQDKPIEGGDSGGK